MPLLIDLILHIVLASCLGGCSYLIWLKVAEKWPRAIFEFALLLSFPSIFIFGLFLGMPFISLFPLRKIVAEMQLVFGAYGISLLLGPSIAALLVWCWQNIEPRAGIDVHIDE